MTTLTAIWIAHCAWESIQILSIAGRVSRTGSLSFSTKKRSQSVEVEICIGKTKTKPNKSFSEYRKYGPKTSTSVLK